MRSPLKVLSHSLVIAWKDLIEFERSRIGLVFSIIFPMMMIGMFGYMFPGSASLVQNVPAGLVVEDSGQHGEQVATIIRSVCSNSDMINLVNVSTIAKAGENIMSGEIMGAMVIPKNFSECIQGRRQAKIIVLTDPSNPTISTAITQAFTAMVRAVSDQLAQQMVRSGMPYTDPEFVLKPISVSTETIVPGGGSYFDFIAPGFIAMSVMMSGLTAVGAAIARERETGTLAGFLMCPISRTSIILGKTISQTMRNLLQGSITIAIAILVFDIHIRGNPLLIALILVLGTISFLGLGIVATAIAKEQESAQLIIGLLQFPMMFLSGILFPIEQMPAPLQAVSRILPLTYAVNALRKVMILGVGTEAIIFPLTILAVLGVVTMTLGIPLFDRAVRR